MADDFEKAVAKPYYQCATLDKEFQSRLKSAMITKYEDLEKLCNQENKIVAFDTETTGLEFFKDKIVGCSISFNGESGFYIPFRHVNEKGELADFNLEPSKALKIIYEKLLKRNTILLYNSTFDLTMVGQELKTFGIDFTDIETLKFLDVQCLVYFLEPEIKKNGLKWAARHFLGRIAPSFEQVSGISKKSKSKKTWADLDPRMTVTVEPTFVELKGAKKKFTDDDIQHNADMLEIGTYTTNGINYAVNDSANVYALFQVCMPVVESMAKKHYAENSDAFALETDGRLARAMLHYKHTPLSIDSKLMRDNLTLVENRLKEVENQIYEIAGCVFNLSSTPQKRAVFQKLGLNTGIETKTGMSVSKSAMKNVNHPIIDLMNERSALEKRRTAYFTPLSESPIGRINYKVSSIATGRLASGRSGNDADNKYFSPISIQTLPKATNILFEAVKTDKNDTESILGYKFNPVDEEYVKNNPNGVYVEGFDQELNVRNALCGPHKIWVQHNGEKIYFKYDVLKAEDYCREHGLDVSSSIITERSNEWLIVSADISAEELCIIANLSKEPSFVEPLLNGEDLHKSMASKMFASKGFNQMGKAEQKYWRKKAKAGNFGLAYRGSYKALLREIPDEDEAMEVYESWWKNMPIYKQWQNEKIQELMMLSDGDAIDMYGRRRRFKYLMQSGNQGDINSGIRAACNHFVQGTAATYMRKCMADLYDKYLRFNENFSEIRFVASIHDELTIAVKKDVAEKWIYRLCEIMESNCPKEFIVPFHAVPGVGLSMGNIFDFEFDRDTNGKIIEGTLHLKV